MLLEWHLDDQFGVDLRGAEDTPGGVTAAGSGAAEGRFSVDNTKVTAFAIIEMCEAVPKWFRPDGELSDERVAYLYGEFAVRIAQGPRRRSPARSVSAGP